ncbi:uncharacterized protein LOC126315214 [Schistocerca gregaria]|uniref:uncharacterized protein LOC126315214 n=1 Tax=Schistocerca gregaria TaxID=7010 RepID=UPI00211E1919|nr:uncharacterized protein LOC126315214 [Schistocerca gregaria]
MESFYLPKTVLPAADPVSDGAAQTRTATHVLNSSLKNCVWAQGHNTSNAIGFVAILGDRPLFQLSSLKLDHKDPSRSELVRISQIRTENLGKVATMADDLAALSNLDGSISVYKLRRKSPRQYLDDPKLEEVLECDAKKLESLVFESKKVAVYTLNANSCLRERQSCSVPMEYLTMDLSSSGVFSKAEGHNRSNAYGGVTAQKLLAFRQGYQTVWDLARPDIGPIRSWYCSTLTRALRWSGSSEGSNQFARGSIHGSVKIYDLRAKGRSAAWQRKRGHRGTIRCVRWNLSLPYWLATAGEDAIIRIWDLRYDAPLRELSGHANCVNSVCWSPVSVDTLVSGGTDRSLKLWNLRAGPCYNVANIGRWDSSVTGVGWSNERSAVAAFGVSATGIVQACTLSTDISYPLVPSSPSGCKGQSFVEVERLIYCRDFANGFKKSYQLAKRLLSQDRLLEANYALDLCYQRPSVAEVDFSSGARIPKTDVTEFEKELLYYSYYIPPNYLDQLWPTFEKKLILDIQVLKTNIETQQSIRDQKVKDLLTARDVVIGFIKKNTQSINELMLLDLISLLASYDYITAISWAKDLLNVLPQNQPMHLSVLHTLIYPTILDDESDAEVISSVSEQQNNSSEAKATHTPGANHETDRKKVLSMLSSSLQKVQSDANFYASTKLSKTFLGDQLDFLLAFYSALWGDDPEALFNAQWSTDTCVSLTAWRIYLNAAIVYRRYDLFYIQATQLAKKVKAHSSAKIFEIQILNTGLTLEKYLLECTHVNLGLLDESALAPDRLKTQNPVLVGKNRSDVIQLINRLGKASCIILNILQNADHTHIPKRLLTSLANALRQNTIETEAYMKEASTDPHSTSNPEENHRRMTVFNAISRNVKDIVDKKGQVNEQFAEYINEYKNMVESMMKS